MRVLLLADACNPDWPSLPLVGYKFARAISKELDVVVATQIRNKPNINRDGLGDAEVVFLDTEKVAAPISKLAGFLRGGNQTAWTLQMAMDYPSYLAFEWSAFKFFKNDLVRRRFDLVHRITPMSPTLPSLMADRCPVPFLLGPLNGNLPWPKHFTAELKREREWLSALRNAYKLLPYAHSTYKGSDVILAAFDHTISDLPPGTSQKVINFPEVGIDSELFRNPIRSKRDQRMTVVYAGRLVPYKLPEVVVQAFARSPLLRQHRLTIIGDGPERPRLEALIREHKLEDCVTLMGNLPQPEVGKIMQQADIFAFPSIRELGAGVVVEAMACGLACIVVDYGGPATLINDERGRKVPMGPFDRLVGGFVDNMEKLVSEPETVQRLGAEAHRHAMTYYSWEAKAIKMVEIYKWVLDGKPPGKPNFWNIAEQTRAD